MTYLAAENRYDVMPYRRCGRSGLHLPAVSLGLWHNFGDDAPLEDQRAVLRRAFDLGVTHFDLANNYGPPYGSAEVNFGRVMREDLAPYRDELIISTKAGYDMWPGPYGDHGSRKYLLASLDQSLQRMGLDYVDVFYSHRFDPDTPLEETLGAVDTAVRQGKALYAGISSYSGAPHGGGGADPARAGHAAAHPPAVLLAAQPLDRGGPARRPRSRGRGLPSSSRRSPRACSPDKYLGGVPEDSRVSRGGALSEDMLTDEALAHVRALNEIASRRGQSLAQMAIAWTLRDPRVTSALIGARTVDQLEDSLGALQALDFSDEELAEIDGHAVDAGINLWKASSDG